MINNERRQIIDKNANYGQRFTRFCVLVVCLMLSNFIMNQDAVAAFEDDEGCLICHKYPNMKRITEEGVLRTYQVVPEMFSNTVHRAVPCRDCHTYIKELPHRPVETGVTCNTECHSIVNPATGKPFSHKIIYDAYKDSIHGRKKIEDGLDADKPYCITCHTNPIYDPNEKGPPEHIVGRCVLCHERKAFVEQWYKHTSRRIREVKRSSIEIVALCSSCHGNESLVERHEKAAKAAGRDLGEKFGIAVSSYLESFHGKLTQYGFKHTANCLDCHASEANYYKSVHEIRPSRDPLSSVHESNRVQTCQRCHTLADENYSHIDPHPSSDADTGFFRYKAEQIYNLISIATIVSLVGLSLFETIGRLRDGVSYRIIRGSSWRRRSKRGRDRIIDTDQGQEQQRK